MTIMRRMALVLVLGAVGLVLGLAACAPAPSATERQAERKEPGMGDVRQVLEAHRDQWHAIPGVQGTGVGVHDGRSVIFIYVSEDSAELREQLPQEQDGVPVVIRVVGPIEPLE